VPYKKSGSLSRRWFQGPLQDNGQSYKFMKNKIHRLLISVGLNRQL